jgi:hypothetical protein
MEYIMENWDLIDVKPRRGKYTWSNSRIGLGHIIARLDRFILHGHFLEEELKISSSITPSTILDHHPISLPILLK